MAPKLRIRRKDLKKPDEFVSVTARALKYIVGHPQQVISVAVIALFGIAIISMAAFYISNNESKAQLGLSQGLSMFRQGVALKDRGEGKGGDAVKSREALMGGLKSLETVSRQYPGTQGGKLALLITGHSYFHLGEYTKAAEAYSKFLATSPGEEFRAIATYGLAMSHESMKDYDNAVRYFTILTELKNNILSGIAYEGAARCLRSAGKKAEAENILREGAKIMESAKSPYDSNRLKILSTIY